MHRRPDNVARTEQDSAITGYPFTEQEGRLSSPRHIAIILDGNRRWAHEHGLPVIAGYQAGGRNVPALLGWCEDAGIEVVTLWPLSAGNLERSPSEVQGLIAVIQEVLTGLAEARRWRIRLIGQVERLPAGAVAAVRAAESMTAGIAGLTVNIALAYDGRAEITSAVEVLLRELLANCRTLLDRHPELRQVLRPYLEALGYYMSGLVYWTRLTPRYHGPGYVWNGLTSGIVTLGDTGTSIRPAQGK